MNSRFDDLWSSAADDGASCLTGATLTRPEGGDEIDELLAAWYRERSAQIECSLVLDEAVRLIAGLLSDGEVSARRRRQAARLFQAVADVRGGDRDCRRP